ncbi:MAG: hydrolase [Planctomycetota bacterium]
MTASNSETSGLLQHVASQQDDMLRTLCRWADVNSGTRNLSGIAEVSKMVSESFAPLADETLAVSVKPQTLVDSHGNLSDCELGDTLVFRKRPDADRRVVLSIHLDTVYPKDSAFQKTRIDGERLLGPGVADAKGGLVVMLHALAAYERFAESDPGSALGWTVIVGADEEVGSPGSSAVFDEYGPGASFGIIYEPCLPSGNLVSERGGSGNFAIVVRGKSAHAGREFDRGRNAVVAAAEIARQLHGLNGRWPRTTLNVARIEGGGPTNVVPELAIIRFNIRYAEPGQEDVIREAVESLLEPKVDGIRFELHGQFSAPPKRMSEPLDKLQSDIARCGQEIGLEFDWETTGGVCDGNRLAALGVPNVDTMGVQGGNIHSHDEYMLIPSLVTRTQLSLLTLIYRSSDFSENA